MGGKGCVPVPVTPGRKFRPVDHRPVEQGRSAEALLHFPAFNGAALTLGSSANKCKLKSLVFNRYLAD